MLEADPAIEPERVWEWINWLDRHHGYNYDENKRLIGLLRENRALRSGLIEHVLLTPCAQNTWMAGYRLFDIVSICIRKQRTSQGPLTHCASRRAMARSTGTLGAVC